MKHLWVLLGTVVLLVIAGTFLLTKDSKEEPEQYACTMEALLCPDGSAVGRSGPTCAFTACPHMDSLTGILVQNSEGFMLQLETPSGAPAHEVVNVVPLEVRVSNALADFVNTRVTVYGTFTEGNTYEVTQLEEAAEGSDATLGRIGVGEAKLVNGVRITFHEMVQDLRCAEDEDCMEAGAVVVRVTLESNTDEETVNIASDEVPYAFDAYQIAIEKVEPPRLSGPAPAAEDYAVSFRVVANEEVSGIDANE